VGCGEEEGGADAVVGLGWGWKDEHFFQNFLVSFWGIGGMFGVPRD
jgi:hypothetical protein